MYFFLSPSIGYTSHSDSYEFKSYDVIKTVLEHGTLNYQSRSDYCILF